MENSIIFKKIFLSLVYFLVGFLITFIIKKILKTLLFKIEKTNNKKLLKKSKTLKSFIDGLIYIFVYFGVVYYIFLLWEINIVPFLTGAGILGLTFSLGAQSFVKDLISGFFIVFDDQFEIGDYVKIANYEGIVKKITLRQTILKDKDENTIIIPNSQITSVVKINRS